MSQVLGIVRVARPQDKEKIMQDAQARFNAMKGAKPPEFFKGVADAMEEVIKEAAKGIR